MSLTANSMVFVCVPHTHRLSNIVNEHTTRSIVSGDYTVSLSGFSNTIGTRSQIKNVAIIAAGTVYRREEEEGGPKVM